MKAIKAKIGNWYLSWPLNYVIVILCILSTGSTKQSVCNGGAGNTADSDIKVQEKGESTLYNLADCVKQYDKHEAETLTAIVEGRGKQPILKITTAITAVTEAYPIKNQ